MLSDPPPLPADRLAPLLEVLDRTPAPDANLTADEALVMGEVAMHRRRQA